MCLEFCKVHNIVLFQIGTLSCFAMCSPHTEEELKIAMKGKESQSRRMSMRKRDKVNFEHDAIEGIGKSEDILNRGNMSSDQSDGDFVLNSKRRKKTSKRKKREKSKLSLSSSVNTSLDRTKDAEEMHDTTKPIKVSVDVNPGHSGVERPIKVASPEEINSKLVEQEEVLLSRNKKKANLVLNISKQVAKSQPQPMVNTSIKMNMKPPVLLRHPCSSSQQPPNGAPSSPSPRLVQSQVSNPYTLALNKPKVLKNSRKLWLLYWFLGLYA